MKTPLKRTRWVQCKRGLAGGDNVGHRFHKTILCKVRQARVCGVRASKPAYTACRMRFATAYRVLLDARSVSRRQALPRGRDEIRLRRGRGRGSRPFGADSRRSLAVSFSGGCCRTLVCGERTERPSK